MDYQELNQQIAELKKNILNAIKEKMRQADAYIINFNNEERIGKPIEVFVLYAADDENFRDCIVTKLELLDDTLAATILVPNDDYELTDYEVSEDWMPFFFNNVNMLANIYGSVQKALE